MIEREREALVGLAIAEGERSRSDTRVYDVNQEFHIASALWQLSGRPTDTYGLRDCLESAALTASRIAWQVRIQISIICNLLPQLNHIRSSTTTQANTT